MKKFMIERNLPGAGNLTAEELQAMSKTSNTAITILNKSYRWIESFVTDDKIYCVHEAENAHDIREHSKCADFPVNRIEEVKVIIDPTTAGS